VVPALRNLYPVAQSQEELDQLLLKYSVVVAEPTQVIGYIFSDGTSEKIDTWYKFKIIARYSQAPPVLSYVSWEVPSELYPITSDEFVMGRPGGTVTIDGVEITQNDEGVPAFRKSQRYLLLVSLNPSTQISELHLAPQGVLPVNPDNTLDKERRDSNLYQVIQVYHGGSLAQLKDDLQKRVIPPVS